MNDRGVVRRDTVTTDRWTIAGTAKVAKDVTVDALGLRGTLSIGGRLSAATLRGRGTLEVEGPIEIRGALALAGTLRAAAPVHVTDLDVRGTMRCSRALAVDRLGSIEGRLEASDVTSGILHLKGSGQIPGRIQSGAVTATLRETSTFGTIVGQTVQMHGKLPSVVDKVFFREYPVTVDRIEAESVSLEGVEAAFVHAPQIALGRGCHVTEVEGTVVRRHPSSYVGPESRTPPPYGLRR